MPITKITLSTAMRARDVSRPHEDHLTEAAEREASAPRHAEPPAPPPKPTAPLPPPPAARSAPPIPMPAPPPRRRRRRRS